MPSLNERFACPACRSSHSNSLFASGFLDAPVVSFIEAKFVGRPYKERLRDEIYELLQCNNCGLIYQRYVPDESFLNELYDDWLNSDEIEQSADLGGKTVSKSRTMAMVQEIVTLINVARKPPDELSVLDFGMGWGNWCAIASSLGCDVYGWDLSEVRRNFARSKGIQVPDAASLANMKFDLINTEQVFEHLTNPAELLDRLSHMLKPGGMIKIAVPDGKYVAHGLGSVRWGHLIRDRDFLRYLMPITPLIHINTFTSDSLIGLGHHAGLSSVKVGLADQYSVITASSGRELLRSLIRPVYRQLSPTTWTLLSPSRSS